MTSHSSQGQNADRLLIHIDTELGAKDLLNNRMAYVAVSRGAQDAQIFTSDRQQLPHVLSRDVLHQSAHVPEVQPKPEQQREKMSGRELMEQHRRHWTPLNKALPAHEARQFAWKQESGTMQIYEHMQTGKQLSIDGQDGQSHDRNRNPTTPKQALDFVIPPRPAALSLARCLQKRRSGGTRTQHRTWTWARHVIALGSNSHLASWGDVSGLLPLHRSAGLLTQARKPQRATGDLLGRALSPEPAADWPRTIPADRYLAITPVGAAFPSWQILDTKAKLS